MFRERIGAVAGADVVRLVLFGSRARGEGHEHSDLDVLVVLRRYDRDARRAIIDAAADVDDDTGLRLSPIVVDEAMVAAPSFSLRAAIEADGVTL